MGKLTPAEWPDTLPLDTRGTGWSRVMLMHMKLATGGTATYAIRDAEGRDLPFIYGYRENRRNPKESVAGFQFTVGEGTERTYTWRELVEAWPDFLKANRP